MRKVSILSLHLGYGGIEKCIVSLANLLCDRYEVEIAVCYQLYDNSAFQLDDRVKVIYLNDKDIIPNHESLRNAYANHNIVSLIKESIFSLKVLHYRKKNMIDYIKKCDSDVIISTRDIFNEWLGLYGSKSCLKIGWEHNHYHNNNRYAQKIIRSVKNLDYLILVSAELEKFYSSKLLKYKCMCVHIPNYIENIPVKISNLKDKRLISVGRLSPEKGYLDLLKVYKKIVELYPDWKLDIVGDGKEMGILKKYISKHNLQDSVTLHGFQGKKYIDSLMNKSSIYLMTSFTESFGIVLIEAMSHGLPCIAFDSAEGAREIINSGYNGYLIKNRNLDAMIKKIEDLINSREDRVRIGKNSRREVLKYTKDVVGEEWFTLIEESGIYE